MPDRAMWWLVFATLTSAMVCGFMEIAEDFGVDRDSYAMTAVFIGSLSLAPFFTVSVMRAASRAYRNDQRP